MNHNSLPFVVWKTKPQVISCSSRACPSSNCILNRQRSISEPTSTSDLQKDVSGDSTVASTPSLNSCSPSGNSWLTNYHQTERVRSLSFTDNKNSTTNDEE